MAEEFTEKLIEKGGTHWNDLQHDLDSKTLPEHNSNGVTTQ